MTLARFGVQYKNWSNSELRELATRRGITLPPSNRKLWIRRLREKDQQSQLSFLRFPPEIRNVVYGMLLTPERNGEDGTRTTCYPAVLRSCKQVNSEAAAMLAMLFQGQELGLKLVLKSHFIRSRRVYGVTVELNGKRLAQGIEGDHIVQVSWPCCMSRLRSMNISIELQRFRFDPAKASNGSWVHVASAGEVQVNNVLHGLYRHLQRECHLDQLHLRIWSNLHCSRPHRYHIVSLVSAIAALAETSSIERPSGCLNLALEGSATFLRGIHQFEEEAMLLVELQNAITPHMDMPKSISASQAYPHLQAIALCKLITRMRHTGPFPTLPYVDELLEADEFIRRRLDEVDLSDLEDKLPDMSDKMKRLKEMRSARKQST